MIANPHSIEDLNTFSKNTLSQHLGIEYLVSNHEHIIARMPVDARTRQPFGLLHGGASAALAETLGSVASQSCLIHPKEYYCVGVDLNATHLKSVREGYVYGKATPLRVGKRMMVFQIDITNDTQELVCVCRLTVMVVEQRG